MNNQSKNHKATYNFTLESTKPIDKELLDILAHQEKTKVYPGDSTRPLDGQTIIHIVSGVLTIVDVILRWQKDRKNKKQEQSLKLHLNLDDTIKTDD